jgi:hypothetical protein
MQRRKLLSIIAIAAFAVTMYSCKKGEVISDVETLGAGAYVTKVKVNNLQINYASIATASVSVVVKEYGKSLEKIVLYVTKGSPNYDRTKWKKIKEVPYSGETELKATAAEIATALGVPINDLTPGTSYTLYNQCVTKDGEIHDAANTNGGYQGISNYNMLMTWQAVVICPFVAPIAGTYKVIQDDWVDWQPGDLVTVTDGPGANQVNISAVWPNPAYGTIVNPLYISVDPATGTATVPSGITWGNYGAYTTQTSTGSSGFVFACTGTINVSIHVLAPPFGDQGFLKLVLQKQ